MTYTLASATSREEVAHRIATKEALFREPDFQHPVRAYCLSARTLDLHSKGVIEVQQDQ